MEKVLGKSLNAKETARRSGDPSTLVADSTRLRQATGWVPVFDDLEEIIETALAWERSISAIGTSNLTRPRVAPQSPSDIGFSFFNRSRICVKACLPLRERHPPDHRRRAPGPEGCCSNGPRGPKPCCNCHRPAHRIWRSAGGSGAPLHSRQPVFRPAQTGDHKAAKYRPLRRLSSLPSA